MFFLDVTVHILHIYIACLHSKSNSNKLKLNTVKCVQNRNLLNIEKKQVFPEIFNETVALVEHCI